MNIFRFIIQLYNRFFLTPEQYLKKKGGKIGSDCSIATKNFGSEPYLISIGNHVQITSGVKIFTHGGGWILRKDIPDFDSFGKVVIGDNVYIGNNTLIMPGVTIGNNVLIGAGSVVTKSIPSGWIVAGNPIRKIGEIEDYRSRMKKFNFKTKGLSYDDKKEYLLNGNEDLFIKKSFLKA